MKIKKFLIVFLICIFNFSKFPQALQPPVSNTLKQGIYKISDEHEGHYRTLKLITPNKPVTVTILDSNGAQIFFIRLSDVKSIFQFGPIKKGETVIIAGDGEISISH